MASHRKKASQRLGASKVLCTEVEGEVLRASSIVPAELQRSVSAASSRSADIRGGRNFFATLKTAQAEIYQDKHRLGRLVKPRVLLDSTGEFSTASLIYDCWQPSLVAGHFGPEQQLRVPLDSRYRSTSVFSAILTGRQGGGIGLAELQWSGIKTATAVSLHQQQLQYRSAQHRRFTEGKDKDSPHCRAPVQCGTELTIKTEPESEWNPVSLTFNIAAEVPWIQRIEFKLWIIRDAPVDEIGGTPSKTSAKSSVSSSGADASGLLAMASASTQPVPQAQCGHQQTGGSVKPAGVERQGPQVTEQPEGQASPSGASFAGYGASSPSMTSADGATSSTPIASEDASPSSAQELELCGETEGSQVMRSNAPASGEELLGGRCPRSLGGEHENDPCVSSASCGDSVTKRSDPDENQAQGAHYEMPGTLRKAKGEQRQLAQACSETLGHAGSQPALPASGPLDCISTSPSEESCRDAPSRTMAGAPPEDASRQEAVLDVTEAKPTVKLIPNAAQLRASVSCGSGSLDASPLSSGSGESQRGDGAGCTCEGNVSEQSLCGSGCCGRDEREGRSSSVSVGQGPVVPAPEAGLLRISQAVEAPAVPAGGGGGGQGNSRRLSTGAALMDGAQSESPAECTRQEAAEPDHAPQPQAGPLKAELRPAATVAAANASFSGGPHVAPVAAGSSLQRSYPNGSSWPPPHGKCGTPEHFTSVLGAYTGVSPGSPTRVMSALGGHPQLSALHGVLQNGKLRNGEVLDNLPLAQPLSACMGSFSQPHNYLNGNDAELQLLLAQQNGALAQQQQQHAPSLSPPPPPAQHVQPSYGWPYMQLLQPSVLHAHQQQQQQQQYLQQAVQQHLYQQQLLQVVQQQQAQQQQQQLLLQGLLQGQAEAHGVGTQALQDVMGTSYGTSHAVPGIVPPAPASTKAPSHPQYPAELVSPDLQSQQQHHPQSMTFPLPPPPQQQQLSHSPSPNAVPALAPSTSVPAPNESVGQSSWETCSTTSVRSEPSAAVVGPPVERFMGHHRVQSQGNMLAAAQGGGGGGSRDGGARPSSSYRGRTSYNGGTAPGGIPGGGQYGGRPYGSGPRNGGGGSAGHGYRGGRYDGGSAESSRPSSRGPYPGGGAGGSGHIRHPDNVLPPPPDSLPLPDPKGSCDLDRFISQVEPVIAIDPAKPPQQAMQELRLRDLWNFYFEPSLYGREVFTLGGHRGASNSYFVPYLSGIQIFTRALPTDVGGTNRLYVSENNEGWPKHMHLKFEYFEYELPFNRLPLYDQIELLSNMMAAGKMPGNGPSGPNVGTAGPATRPAAPQPQPQPAAPSSVASSAVAGQVAEPATTPAAPSANGPKSVSSGSARVSDSGDAEAAASPETGQVAAGGGSARVSTHTSAAKDDEAAGADTGAGSVGAAPAVSGAGAGEPSNTTTGSSGTEPGRSGSAPATAATDGEPAAAGTGSRLLYDMRLLDVHPASWFAVAWYPVYRIPDAPLYARFLTFHSFAPLVESMRNAYDRLMHGQVAPSALLSLPVCGLNWYNMQGERWMEPLGESSVANGVSPRAPPPRGGGGRSADYWYQNLLQTYQLTADRLARGMGLRVLGQHGAEEVRLRVPDYEFFRQRG